MFILRPELDEEAQKAVLDKVLKLIGDVGGTVKEMNVWGKR
ncbi:MAG: 30S ribosomal protein S6, partial [Bacillota bacterium]